MNPAAPCASSSASTPSAPVRRRRCAARASPAATCSSSCRPAPGKSLCYQLPALMRDGPHDRRLAARLADAGPGRGARAARRRARSRSSTPSRTPRPTAPCWTARAPATCACSTSRPSASPRPGSSRPCARCRSGCSSSTRRTASRSGGTTSGPTTSAWPTRPAGSARRRSSRRPRPRRRRSPPTSSGGWACASPSASRPASIVPNLTFAVVPCRAQADVAARLAGALAEPRRRGRRSSTPARGRSASTSPPTSAPRSASRSRLPRGSRPRARARRCSGASWTARSTSSSPPTRSAWASTRRTCARSPTSASRRRSRPGTRRPAAPGATAGRRARCCSPSAATRACTCSSSSAPSSSGDEIDRVAERLLATATDGRDRRGRAVARRRPRAGPGDRRPPRARGRPAARRRRRWTACAGGSRRRTTGALARRAAPRRRTASARAGRQYRSIWAFVEGDGCRRAAILRHFGDRRRRRARWFPAATSAPPSRSPTSRRSRSRAAPATRRRAGRRSADIPPADLGDLDDAILDVVERAQPAVGRTRAVEILRGGRSKVVAQHGYDGLPAYGAFAAHLRRRRARARRRAARRGPARLDRRALPEARGDGVAVSARARRRPRLRARVEPPGAARQRPRARGRDRRGRVRSCGRAARCERAAAAGSPRGVFPLASFDDRAARDVAIADWLSALGVELVVLAGYMALLDAGLHRALPGPHRQRAPVAAAGVPGHPRDPAGDRLRREGRSASPCTSSTRASTRARSCCSARSTCPTRATPRSSTPRSSRSSTSSCPRASACSPRARVRRDPDDPAPGDRSQRSDAAPDGLTGRVVRVCSGASPSTLQPLNEPLDAARGRPRRRRTAVGLRQDAGSSTSRAGSPSSASSSSRPAARRRRCATRGSRCGRSTTSPGFPEIMDGRVKTLNPRLYAGLLGAARQPRAPRPGLASTTSSSSTWCASTSTRSSAPSRAPASPTRTRSRTSTSAARR